MKPASQLTLHLVRHAPTAPNAERRYPRADEDAPLSEEGRAVAAALRLPPGAVALTSPSLRSRETAQLAGFGEVKPEPALAEAYFGVMAGRTWAELERDFGSTPRFWIDGLADPSSDLGPPKGETGREFHKRVMGWLAGLPPTGEVAAFTHAGTLHAALRLTVGLQAVVAPPGTVVTLHREGGHREAKRREGGLRLPGNWWLSALVPPPGSAVERGS
ncbi:histidine phosphatase family protein [Deinococcus hopiensis]|nr:histidine phosphatase family protein [Deinococcus hopiensis]